MKNFVVSARKYRPITFDSVIGQSHVSDTLKNALKNQKLAQAFLFCGPRGVGKTTCARILAKAINCLQPSPEAEACGVCVSCQAFQQNSSLNVYELDAASNNSVEDIRHLVEQVRIAPAVGTRKVYIIDEVHMLSNAAFNAFLKTLEEPPSYVIFILATTEKHKIIPTILSRCQIFDFKRIEVRDMAEHLQKIAANEQLVAEYDALELIAQKADGGLRDALSLFDMISTFSPTGHIDYATTIEILHILDYDYYFRLTDAFLAENLPEALLIFDEILRRGFDGLNFITGLASHFRDLMVCQDPSTLKLLQVPEKARQLYQAQAKKARLGFLLSALNLAQQCEVQYKTSKNPRLHVELTLMKITHLPAAQAWSQLPAPEAGEKKKPLDEPLPAPALAKVPPQQAKPAAAPRTAIPSLKNLLEEPSSPSFEEPPSEAADPLPLTDTFLREFIEYFIKTKPGDKQLFKILKRIPKAKGPNEVLLELEADDLEKFIPYQENFIQLLQKKAQNPALQLALASVEVVENHRPYTNRQKFEYLCQQNPSLLALADKLGLEVDH
ncbi:MAG: hypothetical protein OHK0053_04720 [Microscillaceae bacterium]